MKVPSKERDNHVKASSVDIDKNIEEINNSSSSPGAGTNDGPIQQTPDKRISKLQGLPKTSKDTT